MRKFLATCLLLALQTAGAQQSCVETDSGGRAFLGIDGWSDTNVIAVGEQGTAFRYDGSAWSAITPFDNRILRDVDVIAGTAYAVGNNGRVLALGESSTTWVSIGNMSNSQMQAVWGDSASSIWVAGAKGEIWFYDGSSWSNQKSAAGTTNQDSIEDLWGNDDYVYALNDDGALFRLDRASNNWNSITTCNAIDANDLWGDATGNLFIAADDGVYRVDASSCPRVAAASQPLLGISGSDSTGNIVAVGNAGVVVEFDGNSWQESGLNNAPALNDVWVSDAGNAFIGGASQKTFSCTCTTCGVGGVPEFIVSHDNYGIHCQAELVQVSVRDSSTGVLSTTYNEQITLDSQSGFGTWSLAGGGGNVVDTTVNDGLAIYSWPLGESSATFSLNYPEGPASIDVDIYQSNDSAVRDIDSEGSLEFAASGFTVTASPLANPPGLVAPFSAAQTAGTDFTVHIAAYGQIPGDPACGVIESYSGTRPLQFWMTRNNPSTGSITTTVNTVGIGVGETFATSRDVSFVNGQAAISVKYKDVGRIQLSMKDDTPADPDLAGGIRGGTASFVVKPFEFRLSNIEDAVSNANPAANDADGNVFIAAGDLFSATVSAYDAENSMTPNYGQESPAEGVLLSPTLIAPAGGNNPSIGSAADFSQFTAGRATGNNFSWPEVGIVSITPSVADGDYLGAGDVSGQVSENVGRFVPAYFDVSSNVPTFATSCSSGGFTYIGELFGYSIAPEITFTAKAVGGTTTNNYVGAFFKMTGLPLPVYSANPGTLDTSGLPTTGDPSVISLGSGDGTLNFASGGGLRFSRASKEPAFVPDIRFSQSVVDADGVTAASNPLVVGAAGGILFDSGADMRYGRTRMENAYGSELVNLPVPLSNEYFVNSSIGFVRHSDDACSSVAALSLSTFTDNLDNGETCVLDSGSPGVSGEGCATSAAPSQQFSNPSVAGDYRLILQAPGDGNDGSVQVTVDVPAWLEFNWNESAPGNEDPTANATFGIFSGRGSRIYMREVY